MKKFFFICLIVFATLVFAIRVQAAFTTNQAASVVVGQPDFVSDGQNQGGAAESNTLYRPGGVVTNGTKLIVADYTNNRVLIYNTIPTAPNAQADVVIGQPNMTSNDENQGGSIDANTLAAPSQVILAGNKLVVSDFNNDRVLVYNAIPTTNDASADVVIGQVDMQSNSSGVSATELSDPTSMMYDSASGKFLIVDNGNHRVLVYNTLPTANNAAANVVIGQVDMDSDFDNQGDVTSANSLFSPRDAIMVQSKLIISDSDNNRVLIYNSIPTVDNTPADVVIGQTAMDGNSSAVSATELDEPTGLATNGTNLFIAESGNARVVIYDTLPSVNGAAANRVLGQPDFDSRQGNQGGSPSSNTFQTGLGGLFWYAGKLYVTDSENNRIMIFVDATYSSSTSSSSSNNYVNPVPRPENCTVPEPYGSPQLFQVKRYGSKVILYFTPVKDNTTSYVLSYGYEFDHQPRFGTEFSDSQTQTALMYEVNALSPNTEYFFVLRAQNGCMAGNWGNVAVVKTLSRWAILPKISHIYQPF